MLTAQLSNGFALQGLIPNYFPSDTESRGYATFLEWKNLDYVPGAKRRFHHAGRADSGLRRSVSNAHRSWLR